MSVAEKIVELRAKVTECSAEKVKSEEWSQLDVDLCTKEEWFLRAFLNRASLEVEDAFTLLGDCLNWRKEYGVRDITKDSIEDVLKKSVIYTHGVDNKKKPITWFVGKNHTKGDEAAKRILVYWLEKHFMAKKAQERIVIIFDMTSCGLGQMDLDLIKFLLNCMKLYYPGTLSYLLVYEIPWVLNAAWKIVKSWLDSSAQKMIIFVKKDSIKEYVDLENLPPHMGGLDNYQFSVEDA
jgi:hypothetical protein